MARASTAAENQALNALDASGTPTNLAAYVALFNTDPTTTGASGEFSGGGYARQACTWNAAASGSKTNSTALTFTNSGASAANYFGTFSAVTAGTYGIGGALTSAVTAATITVAAGALTLSAS